MDKLSCMKAFATVVDSGGITKAAKRIGVSKARVSKQVNQLEDSLGVRLLHRTTRSISTTSSGQVYYEQCRRLLGELEELDASIQSIVSSPRGELHVTAPVSFAEMHLIPIIAEFSNCYPGVEVRLNLTDRYVDLVEEQIDVAIRIGKMNDSSLIARKLGDITMRVCASQDYLAGNSEPKHPLELKDHDCIIDSNYQGGSKWTLRNGENDITVKGQTRLHVNSARAVRDLVLGGHGIGYLPSFAVNDLLANGQLKQLLADYVAEPVGIYAAYLHRKHLSPKIRLFIDRLVGDLCCLG